MILQVFKAPLTYSLNYKYPNLKSVRELIYKRGYGKLNKQRIGLLDNSIVEQGLGKYGIIRVEDLIHDIMTKNETQVLTIVPISHQIVEKEQVVDICFEEEKNIEE
ncbi:hypothetical protein IFM89_018237 [Coptis chinensis]|uniref:Uncharacterized protein n=1 Tax=Coptis chinensis TaxID=261450 RepID=A0A835M0H5_9MAGN|nr:hypothetical protein IFM89_018237 [Coptis chinensis]